MTTTDLAVRLYSVPARAASVLLVAVSAGSVPVLAALLVWSSDPPLLPLALFRLVVLWTVLPAVAAWAVRRRCRARARVEDEMLIFERRGLRVEVPCGAIARLEPWRMPVPEPALGVRLRSGRRLAWRVALDDPDRLLGRLVGTPAAAAAATAASTPAVRYAEARAAGWRRSAGRLAAKFPLFALPIGGLFFVTHQWIAYGGPLGQYRLEGLGPWVTTLVIYWATMTIYLALWAGLWRGVAEAACLGLAPLAPGRARIVRGVAEWVCRAVYFGLVPLMVALRYLA